MKKILKLKNLDCASCASKMEDIIKKIEGVDAVSVNFMTQKMELDYDETRKEEIIQKVKKVIKKEEPDVTIEEV